MVSWKLNNQTLKMTHNIKMTFIGSSYIQLKIMIHFQKLFSMDTKWERYEPRQSCQTYNLVVLGLPCESPRKNNNFDVALLKSYKVY